MKKDYKKILKHLYSPKAYVPSIVTVPKMNYLMVSGNGHPNDGPYQLACQTLFPVIWVAKFILKAECPDEDYTVMPMEIKWRLDRSQHGSKRYYWTMMFMQPECITNSTIEESIKTVKKKHKALPYEDRIRLQAYQEKLCGQILHVGPYQKPMDQTFSLLKNELKSQSYDCEPDSHDVYFNYPPNTPEENLKTLIRVRIWTDNQPMPELEDPFLHW
jgi:hypothetical protein